VNEKVTGESIWGYVREALEKELRKPETLELLTIVVTRLVEENASSIAREVNSMLEDWINSQGFLVKNALKIGKELFGVDSRLIRKELLKKVKDPAFVINIMDVLERNIESISQMSDDPAVRERFSAFLEEQKDRLYQWVMTEGIGKLRNKLLDFVRSETFWNWLEKQLDSTISKLKEFAGEKIRSREFRTRAKEFLLEHMDKIEIREIVSSKVNDFDLSELEELINKVSGEQLCGIELFGGILGMLAGLILIDQWFLIGLPVLMGLLWLLERSLSGREKTG